MNFSMMISVLLPGQKWRVSPSLRRPLHQIRVLLASVTAGLAAMLFSPSGLMAQQVSATLSPAIVAQGQVAEYAITYEGPQVNIEQPESIEVPGLEIQGPQSQQSFSRINNVTLYRVELMWQIMASAPGRYTIPAQTLNFGGRTYTTNELTLEVRDGPAPTSSMEPILRLTVNKTDLYVGEVTPITITALFHRRTQLRNYDHPKMPRENFVVKRFPPPGPAPSVEVNGERFQPVQFSSSLSALREGDLVVGPATLESVVDFPAGQAAGGGGRPGFPQSFFQRMNTRQLTLTSEGVTLKVKPLPTAGQPADFAGAVGQFTLMSRLAQPPGELRVGDPVAVDLIVTGQGNFDSLSSPLPAESEGWKQYPSKVVQEYRGTGLEPGSQMWNQVIVPQQPSSEVPAFALSFFDPATGTYQTVVSPPLPVRVLPAEEKPAVVAAEAPAQDFSVVDAALPEEQLNDILTLRPASSPWVSLQRAPSGPGLWWAAQAAPALALLAIIGLGWSRHQRRRQTARRLALEGRPRLPVDVRRDLQRPHQTRREFYALAREFILSVDHHQPSGTQRATPHPERDALLARQSLYCYAGAEAEAAAPIPPAEYAESLATLESLAR
jgi:hypothetical protein